MTGPAKRALVLAVAAIAAGNAVAQAPPAPPEVPSAPPGEMVAEAPPEDPAEELTRLMQAIADPEAPNPGPIEERIIALWSLSGSPTADLLLRRGRDAMNAGDFAAAIGHFTALVELAPDFAEGWNARATAYFMAELHGPSLADIEQTLRLNPQHFGALAGLGIISEELGDERTALAAFRLARSLNPHREMVNEAVRRLQPKVDGLTL
jgi:tetratricopeptide (TPR) repeat protein